MKYESSSGHYGDKWLGCMMKLVVIYKIMSHHQQMCSVPYWPYVAYSIYIYLYILYMRSFLWNLGISSVQHVNINVSVFMETSTTSCGSINQLIMHNVTPIYKVHEKLITESSLTAWVGEEGSQIWALLAAMIISSHLSGNWRRLGAGRLRDGSQDNRKYR